MSTKFHFGKNWQAFMKAHYSAATLERSIASLKGFLLSDLRGKTFLDVGCGSGLHSLSALELGAKKVVSVDADSDAVACTEQLRATHGTQYAKRWEVHQASLLDAPRLKSLGTFDVVYCWGVAHHTGNMWQALDNIKFLVAPDSLLFIAIYNKLEGRFGSLWWHRVKKTYNQSPRLVQKLMEWGYIVIKVSSLLLHLRNPFAIIGAYRRKRGMAYTTDLIDWLGGYPYEYAKPEEIILFYKKLGFRLINLKTTNFVGCNEFLFRKM